MMVISSNIGDSIEIVFQSMYLIHLEPVKMTKFLLPSKICRIGQTTF